MAWIFHGAASFGALLLFLVQPMAAKMALPLLGGSPSVWSTCMLFFPALLLFGYGYAHLLTTRLSLRAQTMVHAVVLLLPVAFLPIRIDAATHTPSGSPVVWLLRTLAISASVPFFALAATGPLVARWYSLFRQGRARNPYFVFAAGNVGSLAALLLYPLVLERYLRLAEGAFSQGALWSWGYGIFCILALLCAVFTVQSGGISGGAVEPRPSLPLSTWRQRALWCALGFIPSSAMLGVTQYLTTDVAAVPLLWILPMAMYLLTFVLVFAPGRWISGRAAGSGYALLAAAAAASLWIYLQPSPRFAIPLHLATLFGAALVCNARLAALRPGATGLTGYLLWIATGGALAGVWNSLAAPLLFTSPAEYPIALVLAALVRVPWKPADPAQAAHIRARILDVLLPVALVLFLMVVPVSGAEVGLSGAGAPWPWQILAAAAGCLAMAGRPLRFALGLSVLLVSGWLGSASPGEVIYAERTFFGVLKVRRITVNTPQARVPLHMLFHGTTLHGTQILHPQFRSVAGAYYHAEGPIGHVFHTIRHSRGITPGAALFDDVAIVGMGAGSLAVYGEAGQRFTFFEIDPAVVRIARDDSLFTYLRDSRADLRVITGDARVSLRTLAGNSYGLMVLDAFSSDTIPAHLLTREAFDLYFRKLQAHGILALHLSTQHLDLVPVVAALATDRGLAGLVWADSVDVAKQPPGGRSSSLWAVLARTADDLAALRAETHWRQLPRGSSDRRFLWSDDFSSPLALPPITAPGATE